MVGQVTWTVQGALAEVVISHPGKFNAMSRAMWGMLRQVFGELAQHPTARAVLVRGDEGHFCAGGDIAEYPGFRHDQDALTHFHEQEVWGGLNAMLQCDLPLVAALQGNCMGAGMEMASCCDLRVAGQSSRFGAPIAKLGFPMAPREAALVAGAAGISTAREMLLGAAVLDATALAQRGFVHRLVPDADVLNAARQWAHQVATLSPLAARLNKQTLRALEAGATPSELVAGAYCYANHPEHQEGISAFLAKRQPSF